MNSNYYGKTCPKCKSPEYFVRVKASEWFTDGKHVSMNSMTCDNCGFNVKE